MSDADLNALDTFAQTNPAFGAICLRWICEGYQSESNRAAATPLHLALPWAFVGLALLTPESVRAVLPKSPTARLAKLVHERGWSPEIVHGARGWRESFWPALRFAVGTGVVDLVDGRLRATGRVKVPATAEAHALRRHAVTLGKVLAREGDDAALSLVLGIEVQR